MPPFHLLIGLAFAVEIFHMAYPRAPPRRLPTMLGQDIDGLSPPRRFTQRHLGRLTTLRREGKR